jgi:glycosyltransferase involved in cell wall biosynthesis
MIRNPPEGIGFTSNVAPQLFEEYQRPPEYLLRRRALVRAVGSTFRMLQTPRHIPVLRDCNLVHMGAAVVPITSRPWMVTMEYASAFFSFDDAWYTRSPMRTSLARILRKPKCKAVLAYSNASVNSLKYGLGPLFDEVKSKIRVLPHAISPSYLSEKKTKEEGPPKILFVGNNFFDKGGRELFYAYKRIRRTFDVELTLVTSVPKRHAALWESIRREIENEPGVTLLLGGISRNDLWRKHYAAASLFCLPTYVDTYPFVLLEAMANKLAIVTTDVCAIPEIVDHEHTGLLVNAPLSYYGEGGIRSESSVRKFETAIHDKSAFTDVVLALERSLSHLLNEEPLRRRFGENGFREACEGRFSVARRNRELKEYYCEALNA